MKQEYILGIDIGGTETKFGVVKVLSNNKFLLEYFNSIPTKTGMKNFQLMLKNIKNEVENIKDKYPSIKCCGVGVAAMVDYKNGVVINAPNVMWQNLPLKNSLEKVLNLKVIVDNDANVATLATYHIEILGKYPEAKNVVCFTLGTGIGGGVIVDGKLIHGNLGTAGELGHITINPDGELCGCGNRGCLERYIGARWFVKSVIEEIKTKKPKTILYKLVNNKIEEITPKILYEASQKKDKFALKQWEKYGKYLGIGVSILLNILNPEIIVLTGGVSSAYKYFLPYTKKEVIERFWPVVKIKHYNHAKNIIYHISKGQEYGVKGAAILAYDTFLI